MTNLRKIEPEADGVLKDGQMLRVRVNLMDELQLSVMANSHSAVLTDAQKVAADERHALADKRLSEAWRNPPSSPHLGHQQPVASAAPAKAEVVDVGQLDALQQTLQARYNARIEAAWKSPKP